MLHLPCIALGRATATGLVFTLCVLSCVVVTDAAAAGPAPEMGGYTGPGPAGVSVKQALSMTHDTPVSLKGNITRYLGRDDYTFTDSTGAVEVKIAPHVWMGQYVAESDTVELQGEVKVDRTRTGSHIRVHRIVKQ